MENLISRILQHINKSVIFDYFKIGLIQKNMNLSALKCFKLARGCIWLRKYHMNES